jgi:hypothetical protein
MMLKLKRKTSAPLVWRRSLAVFSSAATACAMIVGSSGATLLLRFLLPSLKFLLKNF